MGAKFRLHPAARSSVAIARATRSTDSTSPRRPSSAAEGHSQRKTCSALLIDSNQHRPAGSLTDFRREFPQLIGAREIALVENHSRKSARKIFSEFAGQGFALETEHESCKYGISWFRFGWGLCVHLV